VPEEDVAPEVGALVEPDAGAVAPSTEDGGQL
jgi:hypothetical protein